MRVIQKGAIALLGLGLSLATWPAYADGLGTDSQGATLEAHRKHSTPSRSSKPKPPGKADNTRGASSSDYQKKFNDWQARNAAYEKYLAAVTVPNRCTAAGCPAAPAPVAPPGEPPTDDLLGVGVGPAVPTITPQQAAYVAIARLRLTAPEPVIGPSPEINEWKIGAVGYPYWLSADGNLDPAPVSTTVQDLTVRLDAHLQSTRFDLGDGTSLTCTDLTQRWSPAVEPGAVSPSCGHTYTKPSLPAGNYTITAYSTWAVDWSVNGVGGTIPLYQQASTDIPIGELQVLTH